MNKTLDPDIKKEYRKLSRQVDEAGIKLFDRGTGGRINGIKPNLYNNRLARMQAFCTANGLTESGYMKRRPIL